MNRFDRVVALSACLILPLPATAAVVTDHVAFSAENFSPIVPSPVDSVVGSFDIAFDPTLPIWAAPQFVATSVGITLNSLNIALSFPLNFAYDSIADTLLVGGQVLVISGGTNDFLLDISHFLSAPSLFSLTYADVGDPSTLFVSHTGSVSVTPLTSPVPEPSTWAMLILGFAGVGFIAFRKRKNGLALTA
jgi:hypothetical protein